MEDTCSALIGRLAQVDTEAAIAATAVTRIIIVAVPRSELPAAARSCRYDVYLDDGERLLSKADEPVYSACRLLVGRGVKGRLEVWRPGKDHADMIVRDMAKAAARTIEETAKVGPRIRKHRPMTTTAFSSGAAGAA
jgi:hypothetical protein